MASQKDRHTKVEQVEKAIEFLNNHPALNADYDSFFNYFNFYLDRFCKNNVGQIFGPMKGVPKHNRFLNAIAWWISSYCKNGISSGHYKPEDVTVRYRRGTKGFKKWKKEYFKEEDGYANLGKGLEALDSVEVPYREVYGYEWEHERYSYVADFCVVLWRGNVYERLEGTTAFGETFEDLIIACEKKVKKLFGDFKYDDFYTEKEKKNHEKYSPFNFVKISGGASHMTGNSKYIDVPLGELNLRWWKWFETTKEYQKHYSSFFS